MSKEPWLVLVFNQFSEAIEGMAERKTERRNRRGVFISTAAGLKGMEIMLKVASSFAAGAGAGAVAIHFELKLKSSTLLETQAPLASPS